MVYKKIILGTQKFLLTIHEIFIEKMFIYNYITNEYRIKIIAP